MLNSIIPYSGIRHKRKGTFLFQATLGLLLFLLPLETAGQVRTGFQLSSVVPTGEMETYTEVGYGGSVLLNYYPFTSDIEFTFSAGFYRAGLKENLPGYDLDIDLIPATLGIRYNFGDVNLIPFAGAEAGAYYSRYNLIIKSQILGNSTVETKAWNFGYTLYSGFRMNLSELLDFEVTAKYNTVITPYIGRGYINIMSGLSFRI
ncbi:MAG: hypothetical protein HUU54_15250 [Ignavibacteriaceae bacterium]|nr:hypothetical protein [Ignavibacteriaceae bacterium]